MKNKLLVILVISVLTLSGCSSQTDKEYNNIVELTNQSRKVDIQDKENYTTAVLNLITSGTSESDIVKCQVNSEDITEDASIEQIYWFNGSIYVQINNNYMYRFQLDSNNLIESYIKFELEA